MESYLKDKALDMELVFVHNHDYSFTNNIYSLYLAKDELAKDDTILLESDLIYDYRVIKNLVDEPYENMVTVAKYEQWMDGTVVLLDKDKNILDFVEKSAFNFSKVEDYYKTVNIYKFSRDFLENKYIPFLEAYIKAYGKNQYYELVLKILAHVRNFELKAMIINDYDWYEIDDEQDLKIANTIFADDDEQFAAYDHQFGGFWRFPKLKDFCYLVNPYYPPQKMLDHMKYFYETLLREYPSGLETQNLNAGRMFHINSDYIVVGNGAAELIHTIGRLEDGKLLIQMPVFNEYVRCFPNCELIKLESAFFDFKVPVEAIIERLDEVDSVVLVNPDNPSGSFFVYDDIMKIINICKEKKKRCIIDESFADFADENIRYTLLDDEILKKYPNLVVVKSISKSYGVPGLRLGIIASSDIQYLDKIKSNMAIWNVNSFAEYFLQIHNLYENDYKDACNKIAYQRGRMMNALAENPLLEVFPSQANYIMCKLKGEMGSTELANMLVKTDKILIKDLSTKDGLIGEKYIRVAVKNREENDMLVTAIRILLQ